MECMTLAEIFATTIFSVKLMHDCTDIYERVTGRNRRDYQQKSIVYEIFVQIQFGFWPDLCCELCAWQCRHGNDVECVEPLFLFQVSNLG